MKSINDKGLVGGSSLWLIVVGVVAVAALISAAKFYSDAQKYKNNVDALVATAVTQAKQQESNLKDQQFAVASQYPFQTYVGPSQYGSIHMPYPKGWSGYVDATGGGGNPVEAYFESGVVPAIENQTNTFDLRMQVNSGSYSTVVAQYTGEQQASNLTITPYALKKVPSDIGVMVQGEIENNVQGVMIILPLRTNTLLIWTETMSEASLLTNQILPER